MNFLTYFLKSFGLAILCLLLFLSLSFFGLALTINQTILNPDFTVSQVDRLDVASLGEDILNGQILPQATVPVPSSIKQFIVEAAKDTITDLEPWLKQQMREIIYAAYDYIEGRNQHLSVVIQLEPVKESLRDNLRETLLPSPLPGLAKFSPANIERHIDEFYQQIPSTFELNEAWLGSQNMANFKLMKQFIGHFHTIYYALIGFILLLIMVIILIYHKVRGSTRALGATFLSCGIVSYAGIWLTEYAIGVQLAQPEVPVYLQSWLPQLLADTLAPMEIYSIGLMVVGVVLLVVSFVYKPSEPSS
jgi:hypothetical protein